VHLQLVPHADHRLDRERHPGLHRSRALVALVVRDVRARVEELVDAVSAVSLVDREAPLAGNVLDHLAEVLERVARLGHPDRLVQALARGRDETRVVVRDLADRVCGAKWGARSALDEGERSPPGWPLTSRVQIRMETSDQRVKEVSYGNSATISNDTDVCSPLVEE